MGKTEVPERDWKSMYEAEAAARIELAEKITEIVGPVPASMEGLPSRDWKAMYENEVAGNAGIIELLREEVAALKKRNTEVETEVKVQRSAFASMTGTIGAQASALQSLAIAISNTLPMDRDR